MLFDHVHHGEHSAPDARAEGTPRKRSRGAFKRAVVAKANGAEEMFRRIREFVRPRMQPKALADVIGRKVRQVQAKYAGVSPWMADEIAAMVLHFREDFIQHVFMRMIRSDKPRSRRFRWRRAA